METLKIIALCLSSFSLGMITTLGLYLLIGRPFPASEKPAKQKKTHSGKRSKWVITDTGVSTVFVCPVCGFAYEEGDPGLKKGCSYCPECGARNE